MTAQEMTIIIALISAAISFVALLRNTNKDSKEEITNQTKQLTEISTNIGNISREIKEVKREVKDFRNEMNETRDMAVRAEESAKSAHHRIDELIKGNVGG